MSLKARVAVVTGAGSGIGRAIAVRLARDEAAIGVWDLNGEAAQETASMIAGAGGKAIAVTADCADKAAIAAAAEKAAQVGSLLSIGVAPMRKAGSVSLRSPSAITRPSAPRCRNCTVIRGG